MNHCISEHSEFHDVALSDPNGNVVAIICSECRWMLQKNVEDWEVRQRFV